MISPLLGIKNASLEGGGSHFRVPCLSIPKCFNVNPSPEMRWGLTRYPDPVLILPKKLIA